MEKVAAMILAGGKGSRMNLKDINKVVLIINHKPLILRTIETLEKAGIKEIIAVVGFAKESVIKILPEDIAVAVQSKQLGTGDATKVGLKKVTDGINDVIVVYGDDSFLYTPEMFEKLVKVHADSNYVMTFATVLLENPTGYGRIIRNDRGEIYKIVEELNATEEERKVKEVNTGCYIFNKKLLVENIGKIEMNKVKGEFYLTDILEIFVSKKFPIGSISIPAANWRGVNTPEEAIIAEEVLKEHE